MSYPFNVFRVCLRLYLLCLSDWGLLRDLKLMRKTEKTIPLTVFAMLFILGMSVGSNSLIVSNLGRFSGQAALLACFSVLGSIIAAWLVYYLFFRKGGE